LGAQLDARHHTPQLDADTAQAQTEIGLRSIAERHERATRLAHTRTASTLHIAIHAYCNSCSSLLSSLLHIAANATRRFRSVASIPLGVVRAADRPVLVPVKELETLANGRYVSTGDDPQFSVNPRWRPFRPGWAIVTMHVVESNKPLRPILYAFFGDGDTQFIATPLPVPAHGRICKVLVLPVGVKSLRLDPTDVTGVEFSIVRASVRNVSKASLLRHILPLLDPIRRRSIVAAALRGKFKSAKTILLESLVSKDQNEEYREWVKLYDTLTLADRMAIHIKIDQMRQKPLISIIMPVFNPYPKYLCKALDSVIEQLYPHWELCIADDASTNPEIKKVLEEYSRRDLRIKVTYREKNGHISAASNTALELATGEFIALMDHDDALPPNSLYMVAHELNIYPDTDLIYTDEDKIDEQDQRCDAHFKTDWNPELFYAQNLIAHMGVYRTSLVHNIGGFRVGFEGSQDYDFILRFLRHTESSRIRHIPHVLYHWRIYPGVTSFSTNNPDKSVSTAYCALNEYFADVDPDATVMPVEKFPSWWRIKRKLRQPEPRVSIIVPTRDRLDMVSITVDGLLHETDYDNLEVIIVDNDSVDPDTLQYFDMLQSDERVKILRIEGAFNFSRLNNRAVELATGSILGFVNNDVKVMHRDWLIELVTQVSRRNVGAVGAKLYYQNETIQHAGVILGLYSVAAHSHRHFPRHALGYFGRPMLVQNISAVTAACMLVPKQVFKQVNGFDEVNLTVGYNDVDLCLKIREAGYDIVFTPFAELYHLESMSRGENLTPIQIERDAYERAYMLKRWGSIIARDPFYNSNLTVHSEDFGLAFPPRAAKPWLNSRG
jgi:O-antigen biosynthesis protein